jgi:hypothetical protein
MRIPGWARPRSAWVRGVTTVRELALRNPARLARTERRKYPAQTCPGLPSERSVEQLIEQARKLAPKISY